MIEKKKRQKKHLSLKPTPLVFAPRNDIENGRIKTAEKSTKTKQNKQTNKLVILLVVQFEQVPAGLKSRL